MNATIEFVAGWSTTEETSDIRTLIKRAEDDRFLGGAVLRIVVAGKSVWSRYHKENEITMDHPLRHNDVTFEENDNTSVFDGHEDYDLAMTDMLENMHAAFDKMPGK